MISRYALYNISTLSNYFQLTDGLPKGIKPRYNISPTLDAPVIVSHEGARAIKRMKWGLIAQGAKDTNSVFRYKTYNIPSEKILSKHSWEKFVKESRCLVPADGFYQLTGSVNKRAYYVQHKDGTPLAFAGVYSSWEDPEGTVHGTYSIITIDANSDMPGSSTRMPVVISRDDEARWLDSSINDAGSLYDMLRTYPDDLLAAHEVRLTVSSPKQNEPNLITPV